MRYLVHDVIGDGEFYLDGARQIEQLVRQSAEVQSGDVDVRIRSDTDHLPTALLTGFQNEPGYVGLGEPKFARLCTAVSLQRAPLFFLNIEVNGVGNHLIDTSLLGAHKLFQLRELGI